MDFLKGIKRRFGFESLEVEEEDLEEMDTVETEAPLETPNNEEIGGGEALDEGGSQLFDDDKEPSTPFLVTDLEGKSGGEDKSLNPDKDIADEVKEANPEANAQELQLATPNVIDADTIADDLAGKTELTDPESLLSELDEVAGAIKKLEEERGLNIENIELETKEDPANELPGGAGIIFGTHTNVATDLADERNDEFNRDGQIEVAQRGEPKPFDEYLADNVFHQEYEPEVAGGSDDAPVEDSGEEMDTAIDGADGVVETGTESEEEDVIEDEAFDEPDANDPTDGASDDLEVEETEEVDDYIAEDDNEAPVVGDDSSDLALTDDPSDMKQVTDLVPEPKLMDVGFRPLDQKTGDAFNGDALGTTDVSVSEDGDTQVINVDGEDSSEEAPAIESEDEDVIEDEILAKEDGEIEEGIEETEDEGAEVEVETTVIIEEGGSEEELTNVETCDMEEGSSEVPSGSNIPAPEPNGELSIELRNFLASDINDTSETTTIQLEEDTTAIDDAGSIGSINRDNPDTDFEPNSAYNPDNDPARTEGTEYTVVDDGADMDDILAKFDMDMREGTAGHEGGDSGMEDDSMGEEESPYEDDEDMDW